jgi:hypothetical protein
VMYSASSGGGSVCGTYCFQKRLAKKGDKGKGEKTHISSITRRSCRYGDIRPHEEDEEDGGDDEVGHCGRKWVSVCKEKKREKKDVHPCARPPNRCACPKIIGTHNLAT